MPIGDLGYPEGTFFVNRRALYEAEVHRHLQAGSWGEATAARSPSSCRADTRVPETTPPAFLHRT